MPRARVVFLLALAVALCVQPADFGAVDTLRRLQIAHGWWTGTATLPSDAPAIRGHDGRLHAPYGAGQSVLMLPGDVAATWLVDAAGLERNSGRGAQVREALVSLLTFPLLSATAVVLGFALLRALAFTARESALGAIGMLTCTTLLVYTQIHQENSLQLTLTLGGFLGVARWVTTGRAGPLAAAAACLGANALVRPVTVIDGAAVAVFGALLYARRPAPRPTLRMTDALAVAVPFAIAFALERIYHHYRFGTWSGTYLGVYQQQMLAANPALPPDFPFSGSFIEGFTGAFFSPARSAFLMDATIIATLALLVCYRHAIPPAARAMGWAAVLLLGATAAFYARFFVWAGQSAWGDRYITTGTNLLGLLALPLLIRAWPAIRLKAARVALAGVIVCAFAIQVSSVIFWYELEERQCAGRGARCPVIALRAVNIYRAVTGELASEARLPARVVTPNFLPFLIEGVVPPRVSLAVRLAWIALVIATAAALARMVARWVRPAEGDGAAERGLEPRGEL